MDTALLEVICCPETHRPLAVATTDQLTQINAALSRTGKPAEPLSEALIRDDSRVAYPIRNGIPILLAEEGILL